MKEAVIWGFDGVIINSDQFYYRSMQGALTSANVPFDEVVFEREFRGRPALSSATSLLARLGREAELTTIWEQKKSFDHQFADLVEPYTDADNALAILQHTFHLEQALIGYKQPFTDMALLEFGLDGIFKAIIESSDGLDSEPNPKLYLDALASLGISSDKAVVIESSAKGIQAARDAGIESIAVTHTQEAKDLSQADHIVNDLTEAKFFEIFRSS